MYFTRFPAQLSLSSVTEVLYLILSYANKIFKQKAKIYGVFTSNLSTSNTVSAFIYSYILQRLYQLPNCPLKYRHRRSKTFEKKKSETSLLFSSTAFLLRKHSSGLKHDTESIFSENFLCDKTIWQLFLLAIILNIPYRNLRLDVSFPKPLYLTKYVF